MPLDNQAEAKEEELSSQKLHKGVDMDIIPMAPPVEMPEGKPLAQLVEENKQNEEVPIVPQVDLARDHNRGKHS